MIKTPIAAVVIAVALLGGFYGGLKIGQSNASASNNSANTTGSSNRTGTGGFAGFGAAACTASSPSASGTAPRRATTGTITAVNGNTLTIHDTRCNTTTTVTFDQSVIIRKTVDGSTSDLQPNTTVAVSGTRQPDGSIKANTITLGVFGFRLGGGNASGG